MNNKPITSLTDTPNNLSNIPSALSFSSLFSSTSSTQLNHEDSEADLLNQVEIYKDLCNYEDSLQALVTSVDSFKPDISAADNLIIADRKLYETLKQFPFYDSIDLELKKLDKESQKLNERTSKILNILNSCYDKLNSLPMLEQVEFEMKSMLSQKSKIKSDVLLDYAMKLSKFTRYPATFNKSAVGPNNFIWPAEDAMRRGMLALASLKSKELTKIANDDDNDNEKKEGDGILDNVQEASKTNQEQENYEPSKKSDFLEFSIIQNQTSQSDKKKKNQEHFEDIQEDGGMDLDLDLFNPDEFES